MIKICHVTSAHNTDDVRIFKKECVSLAKKSEYEVFLVGSGEDRTENGVNVIGVGEKPSGRYDRMVKFAPKVIETAIKVDADVYHLHDPELMRFVLKLKKLGKKVIFDSHENVLESIDNKIYMPVWMRKVFKIYYFSLQHCVLSKIDAIVVVTPQMIEIYKKFNDNVVMLTNFPFIDPSILNANNIAAVQKGTFVFAGGISEQWSHREIIKAIEKIDNIEYRLFGAADENYLEELKSLKGWEKVYYGGRIPFEQVQHELEKAQGVFALLKPSQNTFFKQGTLGNTKLFEAFANGKPVIATDFVLWKDIVEVNNCGICINPDNVEAIEQAIRRILHKDAEEYKQMASCGKKLVTEKFNWGIQEKTLYEMYEDILGNKR